MQMLLYEHFNQAKDYYNNGLSMIQGFTLHLVDQRVHNISLD